MNTDKQDGWIRLHRAMLDSPLMQLRDAKVGWLWTVLLLKANYRARHCSRRNETMAAGTVVCSQVELAAELGMDKRTLRRCLQSLVDLEQITMATNDGAGTVIRILNWAKYQGGGDDIEADEQVQNNTRPPKRTGTKQHQLKRQTGTKQHQFDQATGTKQHHIQVQNNTTIEEEEGLKKESIKKEGAASPLTLFDNEIKSRVSQNGQISQSDQLARLPPDLRATVTDWLSYKREKRQAYKPTGLKAFYTQVANAVAEHGEQAVAAAFTEAMASGWQGWTHGLNRKPQDSRSSNGAYDREAVLQSALRKIKDEDDAQRLRDERQNIANGESGQSLLG